MVKGYGRGGGPPKDKFLNYPPEVMPFRLCSVSREILLEADLDHASAGTMDHKYDDHALTRFINVRILDQKEASERAKAKIASKWPIINLEKRLRGDIEKLIMAVVPLRDIIPV